MKSKAGGSRVPVDPNLWAFSPQVQLYGPRVLRLKKHLQLV